MDQETRILYDFGLLPALLEDYGYYLIKKDLGGCVVCPDTTAQDKRSLLDKRLGVLSTVDFLREEGGKHRIYIGTDRLFALCPTASEEMVEVLGSFMARMALATATKCGHGVHGDYAWVGALRVGRAGEKQRRQDVRMVQRVHAILSGREYLDIAASSGSLFPNLKASYEGVFRLDGGEKKQYQQVCEQVGDVSVVWQCGVKRRQWLREKKIYTWKDPAFPDHFYGMVSSPSRIHIVDRMLQLASSPEKDLLFPERDALLPRFPELGRDLSRWVFVDFETDFQKCIYLMGHYTQEEGYGCVWADNLDAVSEKPLMHTIYTRLSGYKERGFLLCYYVAERNFWRERCQFHRLGAYQDLFDGMLDLGRVFQEGPLLVQGVFHFKLKGLAAKLYEKGYIGIQQPHGCMDGAQSVDLARQYFRTQSPDLAGVLERYNRFDCEVLYEMVRFLQKYYYLSQE